MPTQSARRPCLLELAPHEQHLTLMFLEKTVCSTSELDDAVDAWLAQTAEVVKVLKSASPFFLKSALDSLSEFQQRRRVGATSHLPHILAYVIENIDDVERVMQLYATALQMSINGGVVSPIQRLLCSKWRPKLVEPLRIWQENIVDIAKDSEPWVCARVRATSAAISRLIGPRDERGAISGEATPAGQ